MRRSPPPATPSPANSAVERRGRTPGFAVRVLALDYGSARCGCALSDPTGTIATPIEPVLRPATRKGMGALVALVRRLEVERVVVGLPLSLAGADTEQTRETRAFAQRLAERLGSDGARRVLRRALHDADGPAAGRRPQR